MAAATPSRPTTCVIPSTDVLLLAEELQGLGGNDIALAKCTVFELEDTAPGAADEVARWLADGFSATVAPAGSCDLQLATAFLQHVVARMDSSLELALSWAHISPTKALNCIGSPVLPVVGLRGAPAVRFSHLETLGSILQVVSQSSEQLSQSAPDTILTLAVFNPANSTLASLNFIFCNGRESTFNLMELVAEVTELHAKRHSGEHIIRSSRLGLLNHLAAPLIAGNTRLFIPRGNCPEELENKIHVIKAVCTRSQVPATDLKWMDTQQYLEAAKSRQERQAQAPTAAVGGGATPSSMSGAHRPSTSCSDALSSVERRKQQRARVSSSLQRAAALGAARLSSSAPVKFKEEYEENTNTINGNTTAANDVFSKENQENDTRVEQKGHLENLQEVSASSTKAAAPQPRPSTSCSPQQLQQEARRSGVFPVTKGVAELTSPSGAVCYGSPTPVPNKNPTTSSTNKGSSNKAGNTIHSYAAAFRASHPGSTPAVYASLSPGRDGFAHQEAQQRVQHDRVPATAALQRRLWASSTAILPPVTDVFQSGSCAFGGPENTSKSDAIHREDDNIRPVDNADDDGAGEEKELQFDLSHQAAAVASSIAHARGSVSQFTAAYSYSQKVGEEGEGQGEEWQEHHHAPPPPATTSAAINSENKQHSNAYEHTYSPYYTQNLDNYSISEAQAVAASRSDEGIDSTRAVTAVAEITAELEKERRVNSVLLKQLQEAQEQAARATAAACSVPAVENIEPDDFNGVLAALQHERQRNTELAQQAQQAHEVQLNIEVELASSQRENAITRARCRALERGSSVASSFAQCEAAVKSAEERAQRLQKENFDLARAVAEAEISSLVKSAFGDRETNGAAFSTDGSGEVITMLNKKLNTAHAQIRKVQDEMMAQQTKARAAESALRGADVSRRTAEDALRRNAALQEALNTAEARLEEQCLAAAEALAAAEELQRERDEFATALEAEQERGDQLLDLAESFRLRAQVGATHAYNNNNTATSSLQARSFLPSATPASGYR